MYAYYFASQDCSGSLIKSGLQASTYNTNAVSIGGGYQLWWPIEVFILKSKEVVY